MSQVRGPHRLSRRDILRRGGLGLAAIGVAPALLAACGGDDDGDTTSAAAEGTTSAPATSAPATSAAATSAAESSAAESSAAATTAATGGATPIAENGTVGGTIDFISWEGYDVPDVMKAWKEENGVELKATYISTHDDIQAKLIADKGEGGWDLTAYYQGYKPLYRELGILAPLDPEQVPNMANVYDFFKGDNGNFWVEPDGTRTGFPWNYGAIGITWDDAVLPGGVTSWYDLLDEKFKGQVGAVDDPAGNLALISHILGYRPDELPKDGEEIAKVKEFLGNMSAQTTGISASYGDMTQKLTSGDCQICFMGWAAMNSFAAGNGVTTVKTTIPEEGSYGFTDGWAIPPGADNATSSYAWINQTLDPATNAAIADYLVGATICPDAVALLKPETKALYDYSNIDALFAQAPLYNNPPSESDQFVTFKEWTDAYNELKAGAGG